MAATLALDAAADGIETAEAVGNPLRTGSWGGVHSIVGGEGGSAKVLESTWEKNI